MNAASSPNPLDSPATLKLTSPVIADGRILAVIIKLQSDLACDFPLAELSQQVGLSESYLLALFKKIVGIPLGHFRTQMRMTAAHDLLVAEFLSVKQVMARVGINDRSHFNRNFKAAYGMPPGKFRRQCPKGNCPTAV